MEPTDEQVFIIDTVRSTEENIMVVALAGTGKSTTLLLMFVADKRPAITCGSELSPTILCLAFNTRIAKEMQAKLDEWAKETGINLSHIVVRTLNSCGHRAWMQTISKKIMVDKDKTKNMLRKFINELKGDDRSDAMEEYWSIVEAIS